MLRTSLLPFALGFVLSYANAAVPYAGNSIFVGAAPHSEQLEEGLAWLPVEGEPRHAVRVPDFSDNPVHPRLFFTAEDIPALRARMSREPYASMVAAMEYAKDYDGGDNPSYTACWQARNYAFLYVLTGDPAYAEEARLLVELIREHPWGSDEHPTYYYSDVYWENPDSYSRRIRHLSLTQGALAVALCYDWCYDAWPEAYREKISRELALHARVQLDDWGASYPTRGRANNWRGIRFSGAGIALLACDEPHLTIPELEDLATQGINPMWLDSPYHGIDPRWVQKSYELVAAYLYSGLTNDFSARGHNVEGWGYVLYPWRLIAPFLLALENAAGMDIRLDRPAVGWNTQLIAMAAVPVPFGPGPVEGEYLLGWRPDLADDNPGYGTEGTMALTFPFLEGDRKAAYRWHYDRFAGPYGTNQYELTWSGATWGYLYYPESLAPVNPEDPWGLTQLDRPSGTVVMRNRFQDMDDAVFTISARGRGIYNQTHYGADLGSLRILGEGGFFATGSGRTSLVAGQSTVMRHDNLDGKDSKYTPAGELSYVQLRENGSGTVTVEGSPTGVTDHIRRVLVDHSPDDAEATAFYLVADDSADGDVWRLNTPGINTVSVDGDTFTITAPSGGRLVGKVHYPAGASWTQGVFDRRGSFWYEDTESGDNKWVQVTDAVDQRFVVTMQLLAADASGPSTVIEGGTSSFPEYTFGSRTYTVKPDRIFVSDWPQSHSVSVDVEPSGAGSVSGVGAGVVVPGTTLDLVAEAAAGYVFAGWESNAVPTGSPTGFAPEYTLQVATDIEATARFVPAEGDANGNGLENLLERAFGLPPLEKTDRRAWYAIDRSPDGSLGATFHRENGAQALRYFVEESETLQGWTELYDSQTDPRANTHFGRMRIDGTAGATGARFLRLKAEEANP